MKFFVFFSIITFVNSFDRDKLCTEYFNKESCKSIERNNTYECLGVDSQIDCFLNIDQGNHQFAVVDPEQALLAASFVSDNVIVVGEVRAEQDPYTTVVLVRKSYNNSFENLRGKRLCHPGFKHDELVTRYVLKEFEYRIIDTSNHTYCNIANATLLEKELTVLSNFFGSSCRPGAWTDDDDDLDRKLKEKFPNLCELCGSNKCEVNYEIPFNDTLTCLVQSGGDVAVTSLHDALVFFNTSNNIENFKYLCPNGSANDPSNPCIWTSQLTRLIVTEKTVPEDPKTFLQNHMSNHFGPFSSQSLQSNLNLEPMLEELLRISKRERITFVDPVPLKTYVTARRSIPLFENNTRCEEVINWCTLNDAEQQKCRWLSQAALNSGLQPTIQCVQSSDNDTASCLNDVQSNKADVVYVDVTYGYIAVRKGLTSVAYPENSNKDLASIVIALKNNTEIKSFSDLKGKSACFPQYGGREWLAFIDTMKSNNLMDQICDYGKIFSDFMGDSCVPGANSKDFGFSTGDSGKLCKQCLPTTPISTAQYCSADEGNKYYSTDGALRCLSNGAGEYAVITLKDIVEFTNRSNEFRVLSRTGSIQQTEGLFVNDDVPLTIITSGEVVAKNDTVKRQEIIQLLRGIEIQFGQNPNKLFKIFEIFNGTENLLFPDSTSGLTFEGNLKYVENFKTLLRNSEKCAVKPSSASGILPSVVMVLVVLFIKF